MLDGPTRQEVERIVEDRVRPIETTHGFTRANFASLKRDLADLHNDMTGLRNDGEARHQHMIDSLHEARTQIRALAVELSAHRAETALRLDSLDRRAQLAEGRLEGVEGRLEGVEGRLEGVEGRLEGVERVLVEVRDLVRALGPAGSP